MITPSSDGEGGGTAGILGARSWVRDGGGETVLRGKGEGKQVGQSPGAVNRSEGDLDPHGTFGVFRDVG